jgi:transcriptional regulator with XRE-family HTH domain
MRRPSPHPLGRGPAFPTRPFHTRSPKTMPIRKSAVPRSSVPRGPVFTRPAGPVEPQVRAACCPVPMTSADGDLPMGIKSGAGGAGAAGGARGAGGARAEGAAWAEEGAEGVGANDRGELDPGVDEVWLASLLAAEARAAARLPAEELLGRGLLRLRLYFGWSQRDVEHASGVDQSTICRLETGHAANVGSARICAILRALRVGDVVFLPRLPTVEPTALELMLRGDPWKRAIGEAERRVSRRRSA